MFLEAISVAPLRTHQAAAPAWFGPLPKFSIHAGFSTPPFPNLSFSSTSWCSQPGLSGLVLAKKRGVGFVVGASSETMDAPLTGILFQPFEDVKRDEFMVPIASDVSLARQRYSEECEAAINEQINVEYCVSYAYHSLFAYFDRDNVALKGLAKFFKESSEEEREHAEKLMKYQNKRGGKVKLYSLQTPLTEFNHVEKGEALYAMELSLALEKLTNEKLLAVHRAADQNNDPQMAEFIESEFLAEQVEAIKKIAEYVSQLRRVGKGHGVWHFDQMLLHDENGVH